ncbi:DNA-directed RNA polymerase [Candidatus Woesearchaeota archaeon]|nr:DNA-directed RNA polymerase [Candidatus Woesearchaeota archaeon]
MFYEIELRSHIRIDPKYFNEEVDKSVIKQLNEQFENFISKDLGIVMGVSEVINIGEGIIIPGDGGAYYDTQFRILAFKPELQEVCLGDITDITDFGAFMNIGPIDGMIHIGQTMDDYVTFSKTGVLTGKETKNNLKIRELCRARIIAISYKNVRDPKIGLTMRQPYMGALSWLNETKKKKRK